MKVYMLRNEDGEYFYEGDCPESDEAFFCKQEYAEIFTLVLANPIKAWINEKCGQKAEIVAFELTDVGVVE